MRILDDILHWWATHDSSFFQIVIGFIIALVGLFFTFYFGRSTDFHCTRTGERQIRCEITRKVLGFLPVDQHQLDGILLAEVEESTSSDDGSTYRVVFVTSSARVALTNYTSSGYSAKADLVQRINTFMDNDPQTTLDAQMEIDWWVWLFFFGFIGVGIGMILFSIKEFTS